MEISQHIKNLLLTNERVILGGFGAFDSKHIPAHIDKETKTMTPPYKVVVFNPEYTEDEGLLAKHLAEKEGISFDNAKEQISEYVKTIKTKLESGEKVVFQDLGEFTKDTEGKYEFSYLSKDNLLVDSFGLPKVSLTEQDQSKQIKKIPQKNTRKESLKKAPVKPAISKDKPQPKAKPQLKAKPQPTKKQKPVKLQKDKPKKKRAWPVMLIILGLIGILLVAVYFFKPDLWQKGYSYSSDKIAQVKKSVFGNSNNDLEIITPDDEEIQNDADNNTEVDNQNSELSDDASAAEETTDTQTEDNSVTENTENNDTEEVEDNSNAESVEDNSQNVSINTDTGSAQSGKYYIIISSVKSETSAQKEQKRFAAKGITTNIIYVPNHNRYRISIGEFSSAKAAQNFFSDFQNKHGSIDAWVWEKR